MSLPVITRPNREPDFMTRAGSYVWFDELVFLSAIGSLNKLYICDRTSMIKVNKNYMKPCRDCDSCHIGDTEYCITYYMSEWIQKAYKEWQINTFEEIVLVAPSRS